MEYHEAKQRFIQAWGTLGSSWGINKTMAQIHALLLISPQPLTTEQIMEELSVSRGNVSMSLRALMDWGIAYKAFMPRERKEHYTTQKDVWELAKQVFHERRKREIHPVMKVLEQVREVQGRGKEVQEFKKVTEDLEKFVDTSEAIVDKLLKAEENWFFGSLMKVMK